MKYDVIIIGSGPAGANAALELSRSDLHILVIEKESLPRKKPCGGAMPPSVSELIRVDISKVVKNRTGFLESYYNYEDRVMERFLESEAPIMIDRSEFDYYLLKQAAVEGSGKVELLDNSRVVSVDEKEDEVRVALESGGKYSARYLIGADGALGKTASCVGLMKKRKFATSIDAEIITDEQYYDTHSDRLHINYFCLPYGYGWIFPKEKNRFSCGVGTWGKPLDIRAEINRFIKRSIPENCIKNIQISGYPIPVFQGTRRLSTKRVLLTGDAAALVDPVRGEGIRFALHSGKIAAAVILKLLRENKKPSDQSILTEYDKRVYEEIGKELKSQLFFQSLAFHHSPGMYYRKFVKREA